MGHFPEVSTGSRIDPQVRGALRLKRQLSQDYRPRPKRPNEVGIKPEGRARCGVLSGTSSWNGRPARADEQAIKDLIDQCRKTQVTKLETEIFAQKKRLADAERKLAVRDAKFATESERIANTKVPRALRKLALVLDNRPHSDD